MVFSRRQMISLPFQFAAGSALGAALVTKDDNDFVPIDVSGQSPSGGHRPDDKTIRLHGRPYVFNCADEPWALQRSRRYPTIIRSEIRSGFQAPYDDARDRPYLRTELSEHPAIRRYNDGLEQWMFFDVCLLDTSSLQPFGPGLPYGQAMLCQVKVSPDVSGDPLFRVEARSNCLRIATSSCDGQKPDQSVVENRYLGPPLKERTWNRFVVRIVRSADGASQGACEVWLNSKKIIDDQDTAIGRFDTKFVWRKVGLYCYATVERASALHANVRCGADLSHLIANPPPLPPAMF